MVHHVDDTWDVTIHYFTIPPRQEHKHCIYYLKQKASTFAWHLVLAGFRILKIQSRLNDLMFIQSSEYSRSHYPASKLSPITEYTLELVIPHIECLKIKSFIHRTVCPVKELNSRFLEDNGYPLITRQVYSIGEHALIWATLLAVCSDGVTECPVWFHFHFFTKRNHVKEQTLSRNVWTVFY